MGNIPILLFSLCRLKHTLNLDSGGYYGGNVQMEVMYKCNVKQVWLSRLGSWNIDWMMAVYFTCKGNLTIPIWTMSNKFKEMMFIYK